MSKVLITVYGGVADEADHEDFDSSGVEVTIWDLDNCQECNSTADDPYTECPDYCPDAKERGWY